MLVCNSIDTICLTIHLDDAAISFMDMLQFNHGKLPSWLWPTDCGVVRYEHGFVSDGISIYYSTSKKLNPNCYIRFSSEVIQRQGYLKVYSRCCCILRFFGVERPGRFLKLSQIDLAFDFQADFSAYLSNSRDYHVQTKLSKGKVRTVEDSSVISWRLWGTAASYKVRCYDKLKEAKEASSGKLYWFAVWEAQGFDLEKPIWRVEYELRRSFLKQWRINRFYDFLRLQLSIQKMLFGLWNIKIRDDSNITRCSLVPEFQYLVDFFSQDFIKNEVDKRPEEYEASARNVLRQAISFFSSYILNRAAYQNALYGRQCNVSLRDTFIADFKASLRQSVVYSDADLDCLVEELLRKRGYYFSAA